VVMDLTGVSETLDYFIIVTGSSQMHNKSMAQEIINSLKKKGVMMSHSEGYPEGEWILLDYGSVIVHIFMEDMRRYYQLERLWGDAKFTYIQNSRTSNK